MSQSLKLRLIEKTEELQILLLFDLSFNYKRVRKIFSFSSWKPWNAIFCFMHSAEIQVSWNECPLLFLSAQNKKLHYMSNFWSVWHLWNGIFLKLRNQLKNNNIRNFVDHKIRLSFILSRWNYWKSIFELCLTVPHGSPMLWAAVSSRQVPKFLLATKWLWLAWGLCCKVCNFCFQVSLCSLTWVSSCALPIPEHVWQPGLWPSGPQGRACGCSFMCRGSVPSFGAKRGVNTKKKGMWQKVVYSYLGLWIMAEKQNFKESS